LLNVLLQLANKEWDSKQKKNKKNLPGIAVFLYIGLLTHRRMLCLLAALCGPRVVQNKCDGPAVRHWWQIIEGAGPQIGPQFTQ
jgi:hypothetical protein